MIYCNKCGTPMPDEARFCSECGASLSDTTEKAREQENGSYGQNGQNNYNPYGQNGQNNYNPYGQNGQNNYNPYGQNGQNGYNPYGQNGQNGQNGYNPYGQNGQNGQNGYNPYGQNGYDPYNGYNPYQPYPKVRQLNIGMLVFSIINFLVAGIIAIWPLLVTLNARKATSDYEEARLLKKAKRLNIIVLIVGIVYNVVYVIYMYPTLMEMLNSLMIV